MNELNYFDDCVKSMYSPQDYDLLKRNREKIDLLMKARMSKYIVGGIYPHPKTGKPAMYMGNSIWHVVNKEQPKPEYEAGKRTGKHKKKTGRDYSDVELEKLARKASLDALVMTILLDEDERLIEFAEKELKKPVRQKMIELIAQGIDNKQRTEDGVREITGKNSGNNRERQAELRTVNREDKPASEEGKPIVYFINYHPKINIFKNIFKRK